MDFLTRKNGKKIHNIFVLSDAGLDPRWSCRRITNSCRKLILDDCVYEVINPNGSYTENGLDYFQIDLIEDWGKSKQEDYTFRQDAKELSFKGGEALRVVQKGNSYYNPRNESHDILGSLETSFSPNSTGVSGSITGSGNAENFYQLEYQLIPKEREYKKLY